MRYDNKTLLLNASYEPIAVHHVYHAFSLYTKGSVQLLEEKEEKLKGANEDHPKPDVVRLKEYADIPKTSVKFNRKNLFKRDDFKCQYCGKKESFGELTYDHVIPQSRGGRTTWSNIVACCFECNVNRKGDKTPEEADMKLLKEPEAPSWTPHEKLDIEDPPESWLKYLWN